MEETTDLFGIPVPSTNRVFLMFVILHILIALLAVISGLLAMLSKKGRPEHLQYGNIYYWSMMVSLVTVIILSVMRWPDNIHLLIIGIFAFGCALLGRRIARRKIFGWTRLHTISMGLSYIFLLTGFYVDNGKNLPFWNLFPSWFFYVFPAAMGIPVILWALRMHPLNRTNNEQRTRRR
jgi:hypothetical protein